MSNPGTFEKGEKKTIALDFDGVLHSYTSGWTGWTPLDMPVPGAQDFVLDLLELGYSVVIYSARFSEGVGRSGAARWMAEHGFPPGIHLATLKPQASLYVDDRGFRFEGSFFRELTELG